MLGRNLRAGGPVELLKPLVQLGQSGRGGRLSGTQRGLEVLELTELVELNHVELAGLDVLGEDGHGQAALGDTLGEVAAGLGHDRVRSGRSRVRVHHVGDEIFDAAMVTADEDRDDPARLDRGREVFESDEECADGLVCKDEEIFAELEITDEDFLGRAAARRGLGLEVLHIVLDHGPAAHGCITEAWELQVVGDGRANPVQESGDRRLYPRGRASDHPGRQWQSGGSAPLVEPPSVPFAGPGLIWQKDIVLVLRVAEEENHEELILQVTVFGVEVQTHDDLRVVPWLP